MVKVILPAQEVPVATEVDVLVVGGGMAGLMASLAAASTGARTALVERYGFLGGMATAALVGPFAGTRHRYGGGRLVGGIAWEFLRTLVTCRGALLDTYDYPLPAEMKPAEGTSLPPTKGDIPFDPEILKWAADRELLRYGIEPLYHRFASGVLAEEGVLRAVILEGKSGKEAVSAKLFIDATGDADIAALAGVPCETGRRGDGMLQPMSLVFRLGGVDTDALGDITFPSVSDHVRGLAQRFVAEGKLPVFGGPWTFWGSTIRRGEVMVNMVRLWGDPTDVRSLTRNEIIGRDHVRKFAAFLRENLPEFSGSYLLDSGPQIGIRESRRIEGDYRLTEEDILESRSFPDSVALGGHVIDIHSPTKTDGQIRRAVAPYRIPYRCLLPRNAENLLVAGRPISATHEAHASLRVMGTGMATGQAAGIAAGLCSKAGIMPRSLSVSALHAALDEIGAPYEKGI